MLIGATSSLGVALAHLLARRGDRLLLCARNEEELQRQTADLVIRYRIEVNTVLCDLTAPPDALAATFSDIGGVNSAYLLAGDIGGGDAPSELAQVAYVNHTAPSIILSTIAQQMAARKSGSIVVVSSVAGDRGRQSNYAYGSAKAGLSAFASGLRNRFASSNVHVMTVKPGFIDTPLTYGMKSPLIASREAVARAMIKAEEAKRNVIYVPWFWRWIMLIIRHIPEFIFKRMKL